MQAVREYAQQLVLNGHADRSVPCRAVHFELPVVTAVPVEFCADQNIESGPQPRCMYRVPLPKF